MLINQANLDALLIGFTNQFKGAMQKAPSVYEKIATVVPSGTRDLRYPFTQALSTAMREWKGPRFVNNIVTQGVVATNKKWESTVQLLREDVEDDQYGVWADMTIPGLARNAKKLPDEQIAAAIAANGTGYDNVAFFASTHPTDPSVSGSTNQSNVFTSSPLNSTNLATVRAKMALFKAPDGAPLGVNGSLIMVPPTLEYVAATLCNGAFFPEAKNNVSGVFGAQDNTLWRNTVSYVVNPYIADTGDPTTCVWYLLDTTTRGMSPFIWQERMAPEFVSKVDPSLDSVFDLDIFTYGVRSRGVAVMGLWWLAAKAGP